MRVYCPNCGSDNEGLPGGRLTCHACTASFEVPRESSTQPPAPAPVLSDTSRPLGAPPPRPMVPPPPRPMVPPPPRPLAQVPQPPTVRPTGYAGPPPTGFSAGSMQPTGQTNSLAIVSLVLGIVCCIPFSGIGAVVTGVMAKNQIEASNGAQKGRELALAGIVLGGLSITLTLGSLMLQLVMGLAR